MNGPPGFAQYRLPQEGGGVADIGIANDLNFIPNLHVVWFDWGNTNAALVIDDECTS